MRTGGLTNAVVTSYLLESVESGDLIAYGLIPEFVGRFTILVSLSVLNENQLVQAKLRFTEQVWSEDLDCMPPGKCTRKLSDMPLTFSAPSDPPENPFIWLLGDSLKILSRLRTSLWLQFKPNQIVVGSVFLAAKFLSFDLIFYPSI